MKKWLITVLAGIIITPLLAFSWGNIKEIWAAPKEVKQVKGDVETQSKSLEEVSQLVVEQKVRQDTYEQVQAMQIKVLEEQIKSAKEQTAILAEIKRKK